MDDLAALRRWYAEDLGLRAPVRRNPAIVEAFASVSREPFLGAGPWAIRPDTRPEDLFTTPDDEPHWLYHDVLVSIDPARALNNGLPSFWAYNFDQLDLRQGMRVLQVGAGTGYYTAILAELVGTEGCVVAVEYDADLAARAVINLVPWRQVSVLAGDGRTHDPGMVDAVVVFAGVTHPAPLWLDRLADGGQLMMPLTGANWWGFMLRAIRRGDAFDAASINGVGIFPCTGGRDDTAAERLQQAMTGVHPCEIPIQALHRGEPPPEAFDSVWYRGSGFWLERTR